MTRSQAESKAGLLNSGAGKGISYAAEKDGDGWYVRGYRGQRTWVADA